MRGPATVDYVPVAVAGFEIVPSVVRARLFATKLIGSKALCASCTELRVRRRANGTYYQWAQAWWGDDARAVLFDVQREMTHRRGREYSPRGAWRVAGTLYHFGATERPFTTTWRFDAGSSTGATGSPPIAADDPLDLLPVEVAVPVRGGLSDVWREETRGRSAEYLTAVRVLSDRVLLLEATRHAKTPSGLARAEWVLTTLDASITGRETISFTCDGADLEPPPRLNQGRGPAITP